MPTMDAFSGDTFSTRSLTGFVRRMDYKPQFLGSLGIFDPVPSATDLIFVERRNQSLRLIPTSPVGAPPTPRQTGKRDGIPLKIERIATDFTLYAHEVRGVRAENTEDELMPLQTEYARRMGEIRDDVELTEEFHRLGALQGVLLDADGSTVIYDFFSEFGIALPALINFELGTAGTDVRQKCKDTIRLMARGAKGAMGTGTSVHALCGDSFYDDLVSHPNVEKFYLNTGAAPAQKNGGGAFESYEFGSITFHNYRGTDDNSTVAIASNEAKFFPIGARDVFKVGYAPAEFDPWVNTMGRALYALNVSDRDRGAWQKGELYQYPLYMCQRPEVLQRAVAS